MRKKIINKFNLVYESNIFYQNIDLWGYIIIILFVFSILSFTFKRQLYKKLLKLNLLTTKYKFNKIDIFFGLNRNGTMSEKDFRLLLILIMVAVSFSMYDFFESKYNEEKVKKLVKENKFYIVEGKIEDLHQMPFSGHDPESFNVKGVSFKIHFTGDYPNSNTLYYTLTKNRNGPINGNGQEVKIQYVKLSDENKIIKLFTKNKNQ